MYVYFDNCLNMLFGAQKKLLPDTIVRYAPKICVGENSYFLCTPPYNPKNKTSSPEDFEFTRFDRSRRFVKP